MYFEVFGKPFRLEDIDAEMEKIVKMREKLEKNVMQYCYKLLDVDFPDRGFLLFWQLPLDAKLKYFEIEENITLLKNISDDGERKEKLFKLLEFLGANPIQKIEKAFEAKYQSGIMEYLKLSKNK
jgi:phosphoglucomutase/phosphomannomutase